MYIVSSPSGKAVQRADTLVEAVGGVDKSKQSGFFPKSTNGVHVGSRGVETSVSFLALRRDGSSNGTTGSGSGANTPGGGETFGIYVTPLKQIRLTPMPEGRGRGGERGGGYFQGTMRMRTITNWKVKSKL